MGGGESREEGEGYSIRVGWSEDGAGHSMGGGGFREKEKSHSIPCRDFSDTKGKAIPCRGSCNSLEECLGQSVVHEEVVDVCHQQTPIPVVSDMTTVVDAGDKVLESIPRSFIIAIKVQTQQIL